MGFQKVLRIAPLESLSTKDGFKSMRACFGALVPSIACFTDLYELQQAYFSQNAHMELRCVLMKVLRSAPLKFRSIDNAFNSAPS
jgi:hypothetical protein